MAIFDEKSFWQLSLERRKMMYENGCYVKKTNGTVVPITEYMRVYEAFDLFFKMIWSKIRRK